MFYFDIIVLTVSLIFSQMTLVISSPSSSTTGLATSIRLPLESKGKDKDKAYNNRGQITDNKS